MVRTFAIVTSTLMCALLGLGVAYIAVENLPIAPARGGKDPDMVIWLSILPPLCGMVLGFVIGLVAAKSGKQTGL